jgi:two-component system sensor histidine kinase BarA
VNTPQDPPEPQRKRSVLAVDDCPTTREVMRASLEHLGYSVHAVDSGFAALEAVDQGAFDAIVLDVEMPGMDGRAVGRALREHPHAAQAVIAMHSSVDEADVRTGFQAYDAFVPKAGHPRALGECVDGLLRRRRG